jgi:DNA-binding transcriptional LysR family regulator
MEIRDLKSFESAARHRSISKAALELGCGQPTVTTHIKKLEQELSMVLFDRVTRPIGVTLSGQMIYDLIKPLLDGLDSLAVRTTEAEEKGPVTIAATPDIIPHTLLKVVEVFNNKFPNVYLRIKSANRNQITAMVKSGDVDAGIIQHPDRGIDLDFEPLFLYERVLITPIEHELLYKQIANLEDIAKYPLILMAKGTYTRDIVEEQLNKRGIAYEVIMELESMDMIKKYVSLGMGVSVGPKLSIEKEDLNYLGMVSLANLLPVDQAGILTLPGKTFSTPAKQFIEVMREVLSRDS